MPIKSPEQRREYQRLYVARKRAEWFRGKSCAYCGSEDNLELHHLDPEQKEEHRIWSWSKERIEKETAKCVVACNDCHKKRTNEQRDKPIVHGTRTAYDGKHKCRCERCVEAASISRNEQRRVGGRKHQKSYGAHA